MNIIFGCCVIASSVLLTLKYKPRTLHSLILLLLNTLTGIICATCVSPCNLSVCIITLILQTTVVICCTVQLRREYKLRRASMRRIIRVTTESRGRRYAINKLPIVTA